MKTKIITLALVTAALFSLLLGCGTKVSPLVEFVKLLPNDTTGVVHIDVSTIVKDPDLADMYSSLQDKMAGFEEDYGIALSSIDVLGLAYSIDGGTVIVQGNFDLNSVRNALKAQETSDLTEGEYKGVEIWRGGDYAVALPKGMFIMGSPLDTVKSFIELSRGEGDSMYENEHVKSIVDRLPAGVNTLMYKEDSISISIQYFAGGISLMKLTNTEGILVLKGYYKFKSALDAEAGLADLEDHIIHVYDAINVSSQLNGEFIELTGEAELNLIQIFFE